MKRLAAFFLLVAALPVRGGPPAAEGPADLARALRPLAAILDSRNREFSVSVAMEVGGKRFAGRYSRSGADSFELVLDHERYGFRLVRAPERTTLVLPRHRVAFVGEGEVSGPDTLAPRGALDRLVSERTLVRTVVRWGSDLHVALNLDPAVVGRLLTAAAGVTRTDDGRWHVGDRGWFASPGSGVYEFAAGEVRGRLEVKSSAPPVGDPVPEGFRVVAVDRTEMERAMARGLRRALDVRFPARGVPAPPVDRAVPHGRRLSIDGRRVILLAGTPEEIGRAHGELLADRVRRCIDSTVNLTGLAYTLEKGRWFFDDLRDAWRRLAPHVPAAHRREMDAIAAAAGVDPATLRLANVFPELFHCSGFAVFGRATADGKLYHGRVLDYMTEIGLQDCAATFVVAPEGKRRFVNVGYAGFVGSVSGMNEAQISLGEMGGRGEGHWDGVPMATLMRRALEECGSLDEVLTLFRTSPRTCEYFYVAADGKIPDAVGIAATPDRLEVVRAGESDPRLGEGIPDAVVLSAGGRLAELRKRILGSRGRIDEGAACRLMDRPVAMRSNLHDVLFVPQDLVLFVARAGRTRPACDMPYVRLDFAALLRALPTR